MPNALRRVLSIAAAAALFLPLALRAQQQDQPQSDDKTQSQAQSDGSSTQPDHMRRARGMRRGRHGQGMAWLAKKLNLTDDQKKQFQEIRQDSMKQAKAVGADNSLSDEQKREKMKELRKQQHQKMFSVLTPEQKDQLKQLREQRRKEMQKKQAAPGDQASAKRSSKAPPDDDDPFAGMTSDDDDGPGNGGL